MAEIIDGAQDFELSSDEARVLQGIVRREAILRQMAGAVAGLEEMNTVAGLVVTGPVRLVVIWNRALISGWKAANGHLGTIAEAATCRDINMMYIDADPGSPNFTFWSNMRAANGC